MRPTPSHGLILLLALCPVAAAQAAEALQPMDVFALQWADNPRISPDGRRIVYERNGFDVMKDRRRTSLWTIDADGRRHRPLAANGRGAAWSPDGQRIAFTATVDGSTQIHVHWTDTGETSRVSELTQAPDGLSWSPDGRWIAFTAFAAYESEYSSYDLWLSDPADGALQRLTYDWDPGPYDPSYDPSIQDSQPQWSPDGIQLLFFKSSNQVWLLSLIDGRRRQLLESEDNLYDSGLLVTR